MKISREVVKWTVFIFLIVYSLTLIFSNAIYLCIALVKLALPWIPETFDLSKWSSYFIFSLWFSLLFSSVFILVSFTRYKRRKTTEDYIREAVKSLQDPT